MKSLSSGMLRGVDWHLFTDVSKQPIFKSKTVREDITKQITEILTFIYHGAITPSGPRPPHYRGFNITLRNTTLGITPLE